MPLKLQHQICETVKEILTTRKQRHMLTVANNLISDKLRVRVFNDMGGHDELKERCLDLITQLKLDLQILHQEDHDQIK